MTKISVFAPSSHLDYLLSSATNSPLELKRQNKELNGFAAVTHFRSWPARHSNCPIRHFSPFDSWRFMSLPGCVLGAWSLELPGERWEVGGLCLGIPILNLPDEPGLHRFADISGPQRPKLKSSEVPKRRQRLNCRREYDDGTDKIYDCLLNAAFQFVLFHQKPFPLCSLNLPQTSQAPKKLIVFIFFFPVFWEPQSDNPKSKKDFRSLDPRKANCWKLQQLQPRSKQKKEEP